MTRFLLVIAVISGLLTACSPTPRPQGVDAVLQPTQPPPTRNPAIDSITPVLTLPPTSTPDTPPTSPTPTLDPAVTVAAPTEAATVAPTPTPAATATPHPDLPAACNVAAPVNGFTVSLGYGNSICRLASESPDGRWLTFVQLTAVGDREQLWLLRRGSNNTAPITAPFWQNDSHRSITFIDWSLDSRLLVLHSLFQGIAPASIYDPDAETFVDLGSVSQIYWSDDRQAVLGWAVQDDCLFSRLTGYDFVLDVPLQSNDPGIEVVGQMYFIPGTRGYLYTRIRLTGQCPNCVYQRAELWLATEGGEEQTLLLGEDGQDFLLVGFQGANPIIAQRDYQVRTCQDPQGENAAAAQLYLYDLATGELTPVLAQTGPAATATPAP